MWTRRQYRRIATLVVPAAIALLVFATQVDGEADVLARVVAATAWFALVTTALCLGYSQGFLAHDEQRPPQRVQGGCLVASVLLAGFSWQSWVRPLIFPP